MKKNKIFAPLTLWGQWRQTPDFWKNFFVFSMFFIILILSIILVWKRHADKKAAPQHNVPLLVSPVEQKAKQQKMEQASLQKGVESITDRISALENKIIQQQQAALIPLKLETLELLRGVLENLITLDQFKGFLQKNSDPWAKTFLTPFLPIKECKNYPQLEALLTSPPPSTNQTLWRRFRNILTSLIQIRKLDNKGQYNLGQLEDIRKALRTHDIKTALQFFEKLSPQEKTRLSSWKQLADARLIAETSIHTLLLELAGG